MDVILVDEYDVPVGAMEKIEAHQKALLHRAFSIFIFNTKGEMLLHKRADKKYHSAGLWSNACCSHPQPGENDLTTAQRRLKEEMGFSTKLKKAFDFIYIAPFENGLTEHEFDHVFLGVYEGAIVLDESEVSEYYYAAPQKIEKDIERNPQKYTVWFTIAFPKVMEYLVAHSIS